MENMQALIWDIDGPLVNTPLARRKTQEKFLISCGFHLNEIGLIISAWERLFWYFDEDKLEIILRILREEFVCQAKLTDEKINFLNKTFDKTFLQELRLTDGAQEILTFCKNEGLKMGIVSNGNELFQQEKLHLLNIAHYFPAHEAIVIKNPRLGKPYPDGMLECCTALNVKPQNAVFIGDRISDMIAANLAGCKSVKFLTSDPITRELSQGTYLDIEKPQREIKKLKELISLLG